MTEARVIYRFTGRFRPCHWVGSLSHPRSHRVRITAKKTTCGDNGRSGEGHTVFDAK